MAFSYYYYLKIKPAKIGQDVFVYDYKQTNHHFYFVESFVAHEH